MRSFLSLARPILSVAALLPVYLTFCRTGFHTRPSFSAWLNAVPGNSIVICAGSRGFSLRYLQISYCITALEFSVPFRQILNAFLPSAFPVRYFEFPGSERALVFRSYVISSPTSLAPGRTR